MATSTNTVSGSSSSYTALGQCSITKLSLTVKNQDGSAKDVMVDMLPNFVELSLFEAITDATMSGYVVVPDSVGIHQLLPLQGLEQIDIQFSTYTASQNVIKFSGIVYRVEEMGDLTQHTKGLKISFSSEAFTLSNRIFVQSGFQGTCSDIASQLYKKYLAGVTNKPFFSVSTNGIQTYTFGAMKPLEAMVVLMQQAIGASGEYGYFFFEDNQQYNFVPLQWLYTQPTLSKYTTNYAGNYTDVKQRVVEQFQSLQMIELKESGGFMDRLGEGLYGSDNMYFDLQTKQLVNHHYQTDVAYDATKSLGQRSSLRAVPDGDDVIYFGYCSGDIDKTQLYLNNRMKRLEATNKLFSTIVYGDSALRAGSVIEVSFPVISNNAAQTANVYDGKFLIQAIRHTITRGQGVYMQELEISKDAFNKI